MDFSMLTNSLAELIVVIIGIIITRYLVPWLKEKYSAEKVSNTYNSILKAVRAAEKLYKESGSGILKKEYVVKYIREDLKINITDADLDLFIESAVKLLDILDSQIIEKDIVTETVAN